MDQAKTSSAQKVSGAKSGAASQNFTPIKPTADSTRLDGRISTAKKSTASKKAKSRQRETVYSKLNVSNYHRPCRTNCY